MCPVCQKNKANKHPTLGIVPCDECTEKRRAMGRTGIAVEFTSESIKTERKEFKDDILQPFNKGELSKEYITKYPNAKISATPEERRKAKPVWGELSYYQK